LNPPNVSTSASPVKGEDYPIKAKMKNEK